MKINATLRVLILAGILAALAVAMFFYVMSAPVNYNEHMYLTVSVMFGRLRMYRDFDYSQMPCLPIIYCGLFKMIHTTQYLMAGRIFTLASALAAAVLLYLIAMRLTRNFFVSLAMPILFFLNEVIMASLVEASNYILSLAFSLAGFYLFLAGLSGNKTSFPRLLLAGFFASAAVGVKLYYATLLFPYFLAAAWLQFSEKPPRPLLKVWAPLAVGMGLAQLPSFYYLAASYRDFMFDNLFLFFINAKYVATNMADRVTLADKLHFTAAFSRVFPANNVLVAVALILLAITIIENKYWRPSVMNTAPWQLVFIISSLVIALVTVYIPSPIWLQYFSLALPFLLILLGYGCANAKILKPRWLNWLIAGLIVFTVAVNSPRVYFLTRMVKSYQDLTPVKVHKDALEMGRMVRAEAINPKIATLYSDFALESGLGIYQQFATGVFFYALGDLFPQDLKKDAKFASRSTLAELLQKDPPGAILADPKEEMDSAFREYARNNGYTESGKYFDGLILYLKTK